MKAGHRAFRTASSLTSSQRWESDPKPPLFFLMGKDKYMTWCNKNHFFHWSYKQTMNLGSHRAEVMVCVLSKESCFGAEGNLWVPSCPTGTCCPHNHPPGPLTLLEHIISASQQVPHAPPPPDESFGLLWARSCVKSPQLTSQQWATAQSVTRAPGCFTASLFKPIILP